MAGLHFDITGDNSNFIRKLEEARNGVRSTSKQIEESGASVEQMFGRMTKAAAAFGVGFSAQQFVSQVTKVRGEFQQLEVAFNTMLGSTEKADTLMSQLVRTAAITPFDLQGVANGAKQLLAYGTAAEDVNGTLVRLGDIAAGLSIPLNDIVYLYGTTMTQGRLFTQDLRQFQGRGIPLADELAKQFGVAKDNVGELVTAGRVGFPEVQKAIESMTNEGGRFGGLMEAQSKTISGQISNIEDAIATAFNKIGKDNESIINSVLSGTAYLVEHWEDVAIAIGSAAVAYGTYKAAAMTVAAVQGAEATLKIDAEIEGLQSLLVVKEKSKNADLEAAVASGTLTETKAMQLTSLREELATRLAVLKLKEEEAVAEQASALSVFNTAKQASDAANDRLEKMDALYQAALIQGDASYEQYAMEQLQTASANANTASTALNTAEKNLNAASSKRKAASEAVDTMATQANTVANHVNTASMNIMKLAGIQLTTMLKGMWATLMANPLMLVAGAVVGLGYALYKVVTAETEAETATRMYSEALDEQKKKQEEYKERIDSLIKAIDDNNKSEGERLQAFEALKAEYPTVLSNLLTEAEYLKEIAKYKKLIAEEDNNRTRQSDIEILEEAKRKLKYYQNTRKNGTSTTLVDMDGNGWASDNVEDAIKAQLEIVKKATAKVASHNVTSFLGNIKDMEDGDIASVIDGINNSLKALGKSGDDAIATVSELGGEFSKTQLSSIKNALETEQKSRSGDKKPGEEWLASYKKTYEDAEKAYNDFLNSKQVMSEAERDKELARLKELRDAAKTTYESKGGSVSSDNKLDKQQESAAEKLRKEQEKITELERKQSLERQRQQQDLENQAAQVKIDAMTDGYEKEKAQRDLNNKMELENLERQKEDYIQKVVDMQRQVFEAEENAKAAKDKNYQKKTFDASSVSVDTSIFNKIEQDTKKKQAAETAKYYTDVLSKYQDYITKRLNAEKQFNTERERLKKSGASEAQLKELEYQRNETYNSIDKEFAMREDSFQSWADGIANLSLKKLSELLLQAERELERMEFLTPNDPKLAEQRAKVTTLKNAISDKQNKTQTTPDERSNKEWQELYKTLTEVENQFDEIGNAVGGTVGDVISSAGKITASTLQMINGIISFGEISADNIKGVSATTAQAIASVEKASVILAIIGAALQIASKIASLFKGTDYMEEFRKEMEKLNYELSLAKLNSEISADENNIFGDDLWKNAIKNVELANDALDRYNGTLDKIKNRKILSGFAGATAEAMGLKNTFNSLGASIANMQVQVQHKTWFRSTKYKSLKDAVPELFNADGTVNQKALEEFIGSDTFGKLSGENQKYLQEMSDYWKSYQDAVEKVKDYLSDIFGDLGGTLTDALVDAWANGTDAATAYYESVSEMLENLSKQMIYSAVFGDIFKKAQQKMLDVTQDTDLSADEKFAEYIKLLGSMTDEVMGKQGDFNALLEAYQKMAKEKGFDIFSPESADSAKEALESFVSDMQSALTSLDVTAKDVSDNIYDYFRQAMINALYEKEYKSKMEELYKSFEDLSADGLSESDMAQLGSQIDQYIEQMMKGVEDVNSLFADKLKDNEDLQSFVDNVKSAMSSIEATAEDVTDNIFEYIRQQMVEKMFADTFQPQIEEFYKKVQEAMSDGDITDAEKDALRSEAEKLANDIVATKDILSDTLGITSKNLQKELEEEFKSFSDGILNSLYNAEVTAESVAKDIAESMRKELIEAMYIEQYEPRIKAIWEKWKEYSADGLVTDEERANIKADIDEIGKEVADAAKEISDAWKDSGEEVKKAFESFSDSIKSVLYNAEATAEDVANNIYQYMRNALVDSMFTAQLQPQIQAWYDKYTEFMKDGAIDTAERKTLDEMIAEIQKAGVDIVDAANALFPTLDTGAIKRAEEAAQEAENARNEAEQEWESFSDSILDSLYDIEATAEDISDDMSEYMRKALIKAMYVENFKPQMQKWYNEWQRAMGDDNLTSEEKQLLDSMKQTMVDDMKKEVDAINQFFGTMFSQQASSKGYETISQDTGEELNGRFTALNESSERIRAESAITNDWLVMIYGAMLGIDYTSPSLPLVSSDSDIKNSMLSVITSMNSLVVSSSDNNGVLNEIRNIMLLSNGYLEDISTYTKKILDEFSLRLSNIDRNTQNW